MARARVLSFMSQWGHSISSPSPPPADHHQTSSKNSPDVSNLQQDWRASVTQDYNYPSTSSSPAPDRRSSSRTRSRPTSMIQTFHPPVMEVAHEAVPELQPVFMFINSHTSKLYQEGYFLKLHDLDSRGRPSVDRRWQECFAQLVGTVLSVWDAAELDAAGEHGEVMPTFINLADASIKMIESLPMNETSGQTLQNVLSVSTAANNRYLFHFSTLNSLTQWTAAIRLSMFENSSLQESYTGSLVAGKGKTLNNIRQIMERTRFPYEDWARVRFGAGTPWRRCWVVVTPPDEKEVQKAQRKMKKSRNPYAKLPVVKGTLKFYDSKRITKRTKPIATIVDAFSAYAVYPQSRPLIEQSTLVKIEGQIIIHADREKKTDGFVFVMPETHRAVTGFEMMIRFLFPVWDTFALYGRPNRLVADVRDSRGLMFAMPKDRRYGYLELLDVANLILTDGSGTWSEREWRKRLKDLTSTRMLTMANGEGEPYNASNKANISRSSLPVPRTNRLRFEESPSGRNSPNVIDTRRPPPRELSVPPNTLQHRRSASEGVGFDNSYQQGLRSSFISNDGESPPAPPPHGDQLRSQSVMSERFDRHDTASESSGKDSGEKSPRTPERNTSAEIQTLAAASPPPQPVAIPPALAHGPSHKPLARPAPMPNPAHLDSATLSQLAEVSRPVAEYHQNGYGFQAPREGQNPYSNTERVSWSTLSSEDEHPTSMMQQHYQYVGQQPPRGSSRYPPSTLATIPASPYVVTDSGQINTPNSYFQQAQQTIPEHPRPDPPPHKSSSGSVSRKPLPGVGPKSNLMSGNMGVPNGRPTKGRSRSSSPANDLRVPPPTYGYPPQQIPEQVPPRLDSPHKLGPARPNGLGDPFNPVHPQQGSPGRPNMNAGVSTYAGYPVQANQSFGNVSPYPPAHPVGPPPLNQNVQGMGPPPSTLSYGGQVLPYTDVMAMRKRDLQMYGPEYVKAMERAPQVMAFREGPQRG